MLKKVSELDKDEKLLLLKSIAAKEVDPLKLNEDTLIAIEKSDWHYGINISIARNEAGVPANIIYLGEAKKAIQHIGRMNS